MVLANDPWQSSVFYIDADHLATDWGPPGISFYPSYCTWSLFSNLGWVYVFFSAEFNFPISFFDLYIYTLMHITETSNLGQVVNIYILLKFSVWCHVIFFCWHSRGGVREWEAVCPGFWRRSDFSITRLSVVLKLWTIHQECLYQGVLL